jgi:hypothetical protein
MTIQLIAKAIDNDATKFMAFNEDDARVRRIGLRLEGLGQAGTSHRFATGGRAQ